MAPTLAPLMNRPTAVDLSCSGNHSATTFMPPAKLPDSEIPSKNRKQLNEKTLREKLVIMLAIDHITTRMLIPRFEPTQSIKAPEKHCPNVYAMRNAFTMVAISEFVK